MHDAMAPWVAIHDDLLTMTERLVREYADLPAGTVIRCVARCRYRMTATGIREGLVPATEAAARVRLHDLVSVRSAA